MKEKYMIVIIKNNNGTNEFFNTKKEAKTKASKYWKKLKQKEKKKTKIYLEKINELNLKKSAIDRTEKRNITLLYKENE